MTPAAPSTAVPRRVTIIASEVRPPGAHSDIDGNVEVVFAMRVQRGVVLSAELAVPILNRGEIDGFMLINHKSSREAYRPDEILVSHACSSADEMRTHLQLALAHRTVGSMSALSSRPEGGLGT